MLNVALGVPASHLARARYALDELAMRWGLPWREVESAREAHLLYGEHASAPDSAVHVPFEPRAYDPACAGRARRDERGRALWLVDGAPDPVGGTFRLLALLDESAIPESARDRRGVFPAAALPDARREVLDVPLVEHHADALLASLLARHPGLAGARRPRWPAGAVSAVAPSHDVDAVRLGSPAEIATNLAKAVLRRSPNHLALAGTGARRVLDAARDPYLTFEAWREWESARGLASAFYVYHRPPGTPRDLNDCKSSLAETPVDWRALAALVDAGWEFGLHPSIHCKDTPGSFAAARAWLSKRLGRPVEGLRHHYWALDWRSPIETLREHARAGFRYDSSIAWRDHEGFRAGTALPYFPWDPDAERALDLVELPCNLMDGHVLLADPRGRRRDATETRSRGERLIARVTAVGGLLTPNWHSETAFNRLHLAGYLETLEGLLAPLLHDAHVWRATPRAVAEHWRQQRESLRG